MMGDTTLVLFLSAAGHFQGQSTDLNGYLLLPIDVHLCVKQNLGTNE